MRILIQFPEGLKQKGLEISKKYEAEGHEVFLSASPCYGACDICIDEARWIKADRIIHIGHSRFVNKDLDIPVEYVEYSINIDISGLESVLPHIKDYKNIALATTVQHVHQFDEMKAFFEKNGKKVFAEPGARTKAGQVLGCDASSIRKIRDNIDAVVFIGNGMFHPLAIELDKPVFVCNNGKVKQINDEIGRLRKKRKGAIAKALTCKTFGILVSTKVGQFNLAQAISARDELKKRGFEAVILVTNEIEPITIKNFMVFDCYINTSCPRLADDVEEMEKPVLNMDMFRELLELAS